MQRHNALLRHLAKIAAALNASDELAAGKSQEPPMSAVAEQARAREGPKRIANA
ncbi:hypothetical protein GCM10010486_90780 [Nonomuraea roseoviolacea subsp. carminata]|uniref:Uncharacterized protein n=1 Tax=Nonomuraea roseoviolacea subsp. carminata TaxID=160689 RepID=A0ABT1KG34_9ACTN|nr:hypothetical protein [Nonomuraea roseoviolacea subsp. carminata]